MDGIELEKLKRDVVRSLNIISENAHAYIFTDSRGKEAHEYCQKYCMPESWGKNVWHAILDDAIKMREQLEDLRTANAEDK